MKRLDREQIKAKP